MKKLIYISAFLMLFAFAGCGSAGTLSQSTSAVSQESSMEKSTEKQDETRELVLGIEAAEMSQELRDYVDTYGKDEILLMLRDPGALQIPDFSVEDVYLMEPFIVHAKLPDGEILLDSYAFPVVSKGKVIFCLTISENTADTQSGFGATNGAREELSAYLGDTTPHQFFYVHNEEGTAPAIEITQATDKAAAPIKVLMDLSNCFQEEGAKADGQADAFDWEFTAHQLQRSQPLALKQGDEITISAHAAGTAQDLALGVITPDGTKIHLKESEEMPWKFSVEEDGNYYVYGENLSSNEVSLVGHYVVQSGR